MGAAYGSYARAKLARLGSLPPDVMPTLREAGRLAIDLDLLGRRLDVAQAMKRPRRAELRRLRAEARKTRGQLLALERRLEEVAGDHRNGHDLAAALRERRG